MAVSPFVAVIAVLLLIAVVLSIWWLRYNEKKKVIQNVTRRPQPYLGSLANNIYRIPLSNNYIYQTPPPTFSKAVNLPTPTRSSIHVLSIQDLPPPTYEQYVKSKQFCNNDNSV